MIEAQCFILRFIGERGMLIGKKIDHARDTSDIFSATHAANMEVFFPDTGRSSLPTGQVERRLGARGTGWT
jgi:hypothetical protein